MASPNKTNLKIEIMNKNELRIGNLVNEEVLGNCEVSDICEHVVMVKVNNGKLDGTVSKVTYTLNYRCINPIPLTEKWLLAFGVKFGWDNFDIEFLFDEYNLRYRYEVGMSAFIIAIKYVHELQNIYFALKGEELMRVDGF